MFHTNRYWLTVLKTTLNIAFFYPAFIVAFALVAYSAQLPGDVLSWAASLPKIEAEQGSIYLNVCKDVVTELHIDRMPIKAQPCEETAVEKFSISVISDELRKTMALAYLWLVIFSGVGSAVLQAITARVNGTGRAKSEGKTAPRAQ